MAPLNILTLNVKGLNSPHKRVKAFQTFASLRASVVALQETHFSKHHTPGFFSSKYSQVFTASAETKHRGVLLAFHHTTPFTLQSEIKDPEGRYLILVGLLQDTTATFVSYYAPNANPNPFFSHLLQVVKTHSKGTLFLCGDSNSVLQPHLDKSPYTPEHYTLSAQFRRQILKASLLDTWRECNPIKKNVTFYSNPHNSFSRIDHIFISIASAPILLQSHIQPITWTDHCAVITAVSSLIPQPTNRTWCMNDALLTNQSYCLDIQIALKDYLLHNTTPDISPTLLWEAHKPVIRGTCISVASHLKKDRIRKQQQLESDYHQSFLQFQSSPTEAHKRILDKIKLELDILLAESADKAIRRSNHTIYTKANKPDSFLALRLRRPDRVRVPIRLRLAKDSITSNPIKVLSEFRRQLSKLYEAGAAFPMRQAEKLFHNPYAIQ